MRFAPIELLTRASTSVFSSVQASLQRNLVAFVLRKLLATYLARSLSDDDLRLRLLAGTLELNNLDLKADAITSSIHAFGLSCRAGSVASLSIKVPWHDLLGGNFELSMHGVTLDLELCTPVAPQDTHGLDDIDLAESFVEEADDAQDYGLGDLRSLTTIVHDMAARIFGNLIVSIGGLQCHLHLGGAAGQLRLDVDSIDSSPEAGGAAGRRFDIGRVVLSQALPHFDARPSQSRERSMSSASGDSLENNDMLQSTIFGLQEGRSLYMSAVEGTSVYRSALEEEAPSPSTWARLLELPAGLHILLDTADKAIHLDARLTAARLALGLPQAQALFTAVNTWQQLQRYDLTTPTNDLSTPLSITTQFDAIEADLQLLHDHSLDCDSPVDASTIRCRITDIAYKQATSGARQCTMHSVQMSDGTADDLSLAIGSSTQAALVLDVPTSEAPMTITSGDVTLCASPKALSLLDDLSSFCRTFTAISIPAAASVPGRRTHGRCSIARTEIQAPFCTVNLAATTIAFELSSEQQVVCATTDMIRLNDSTSELCRIEGDSILDIATSPKTRSPRRLQFVNFDTLFVEAARDDKAEQEAYQDVQSLAREAAALVVRARLGTLRGALELEKLCKLRDAALSAIQDRRPGSAPADEALPMSIASSVNFPAIDLSLSATDAAFHLEASNLRAFACSQLRGLAIAGLEIECLTLHHVAGQRRQCLIADGHHITAARPHASASLRLRRSLKSGEQFARLMLRDLRVEYDAQLSWLSTAQEIAARLLPPSSGSNGSGAIDVELNLSNVSVGLTPYITRSKAYLYFRQSTLGGRFGGDESIARDYRSQAGIIDLFLLNDVEGGQNDATETSKKRKDPVLSALVKLGFVHVVTLETIEIVVRHTPSSDIHKAVLSSNGLVLTMRSCADSTQTLLNLLSMLRLPVELDEELKYRLGLTGDGEVPIDLLADIEQSVHLQSSKLDSLTEALDARADNVSDALEDDLMDALNEHYLSQSLHDARPLAGGGSNARPRALLDFDLKNCHVFWNLHDGYDWDTTRQTIGAAVESALTKAQRRRLSQSPSDAKTSSAAHDSDDENEQSQAGDLLFNSIYIALPAGTAADEARQQINAELAQAELDDNASQSTLTSKRSASRSSTSSSALQLGRSRAHKVRIELGGVHVVGQVFDAEEGQVLHKARLAARDIDIVDNVSTSTWRKFMTYMRAAGTRAAGENMATLDISAVRPVAGLAAAELVLKTELAPMRLHVDQDTLEFITRFFEFRDESAPVPSTPAEELFIQRFEVMPFPVQVDYKPKRMNYKGLRSGRTTELKNLFQLEDSIINMGHVILYGVNGFATALQQLNDLWLDDIRRNQLPTVLAGVTSIRSLANIGSGLRDLVMMPYNDYRKHGKVTSGLRRGVYSFAKTSGAEALRLGAKLAVGTQGVLEKTEAMITRDDASIEALNETVPRRSTSRSSSRSGSTVHGRESRQAISAYANPPVNLREGVTQAVQGMRTNIGQASSALRQLPRDLDDAEGNIGDTARAAARSVPVAVLRPLIGTTEMISKTLMGLRNTIDPQQRKLNEDKYK